ncbi:MAG TPA: DUF6249 domain-containing protein [Usitatibacter sp.]|jgi:hypothetical protein
MDLNGAVLIPLAGTLVTFALPILLVAVILYYKHRKNTATLETITKLAEKGLPVPPELLTPPPSRGEPGLMAGLVLTGMGVGLAIFFSEVGAPWSIGLIPGLMGVALLIGWSIESRRRR